MSDEDWSSVVETNLTSVFRFSRAAYLSFVERGAGKILNIGSMFSLFGSPIVPSYSASKGGVIQLTKSLAIAWAPQNIQVNAMLPGWINTDMTAFVQDTPEIYESIIARTPAGRFGDPEECAGTAIFLTSGASNFRDRPERGCLRRLQRSRRLDCPSADYPLSPVRTCLRYEDLLRGRVEGSMLPHATSLLHRSEKASRTNGLGTTN